jgi:hypothetical protein
VTRKTPQAENKVSLPAAALLSFLKETRGLTSWTAGDFAKALRLSPGAAKEALPILEMQGYVKPAGAKGKWITTEAGETVSSSKFPRYSRETIEQSLASLTEHLKRVNEDHSAQYKVVDAVAFGDFLSGRARVQAADVGVGIVPRNPVEHESKSATEREKQEAFLKQLKGKTPLLNVQSYAEWMSARTHRRLV